MSSWFGLSNRVRSEAGTPSTAQIVDAGTACANAATKSTGRGHCSMTSELVGDDPLDDRLVLDDAPGREMRADCSTETGRAQADRAGAGSLRALARR